MSTHRERLDLPFGTDAPAIARRFVADHAEGLPRELLDDTVLLVSEVVTNAVRYGQPDITLELRLDPPGVGISVSDHGNDLPVLSSGAPDPSAGSGRGLLIVAAVADRWGVDPHADDTGKTVWFELGR